VEVTWELVINLIATWWVGMMTWRIGRLVFFSQWDGVDKTFGLIYLGVLLVAVVPLVWR
jgi:hypothetical protein